jgi:hypothetical protein
MIYLYLALYCATVAVLASFILTYKKEKAEKRKKHFLEEREEYYRNMR